jgi:N6-L-threonylcarbamoyladenine synthase
MLVLGIETTCDETACSVVKNGKEILSNIIATQTDLHSIYGGVYPELACRRHFELIIPMVDQALKEAHLSPADIDLISVAYGPGLIGALLLGVHAAKSLSLAWNKPFIGVNHVEAHFYAAWMGCENPEFPALGVVVSGGHTFLVKMQTLGHYEMIGQTVDDAIGEAFDKVAVILGLPYPGGPQIEELARQGNPKLFPFKSGVVKGRPWDFSFSGLKTNVLYTVKGQNCDKKAPSQITEQDKPHIAASFQEAALKDISSKAIAATEQFGCKMIFLGGGVTHNQRLRELFQASKVPVHWPLPGLSLDNAAMIAGLGYHLFIQRNYQGDSLDLEPKPRISPEASGKLVV